MHRVMNGQVSLISRLIATAEDDRSRTSPQEPGALDAARVDEFNAIIQSVAPGAPRLDAALIASTVRQLAGHEAREGALSVQRRLEDAERLCAMAADAAWRLGESDSERIGMVMSYVLRQDDLIPDDVPVYGMLDDAVLIELAQRALRREVEDYVDFCRFREAEARARGVEQTAVAIDRRDWLAWRRVLAQRPAPSAQRRFVGEGEADAFRIR
ncbi:MAG TPA: YkvA family protein [Candidatus Saccharimonadia bacterium]|nr:YkvA family protein [Candidatus Saccharimonadia bacterium]